MSFTFRRKDGERHQGLMSTEILDIEGEDCLVSVTRDVTESKRIEGSDVGLAMVKRI
jgi:hypothetical protein